MNSQTIVILSAVLSVIGAVLLFVLVMPEKKRAQLSKFCRFLHDFFNFKQLWLETILKAVYVLATLFTIFYGFFMLFGISIGSGRYSYHVNTFPQGLAIMFLGPIVLRIFYEAVMLALIAVKNIIEINKKLPAQPEQKNPATPVAPVAPAAPEFVYCSECGTRYERALGHCPNCGKQ